MRYIALALSLLASAAHAQQPNGVINAPIYATGYISQVGGTNITTKIAAQPNHPTNLNIYTTSAITGVWTIQLPNPAFEGQVLSFNCGEAAAIISVTSSDGSSIDSTIPTTCPATSGFSLQFDQRNNIWRVLGSNLTAKIPVKNDVANLVIGTSVQYGLKTFGDSLTVGKGSTSPSTLGWVARLVSDYGIPASSANNYAVEGYTNADIQTEIFNNLTPADTNNPAVTIWSGANDVDYVGNSYYKTAYTTMLMASGAFAALPSSDQITATDVNTVLAGSWANDTTFSSITGKKSTTLGSTYTVNFWSASGIVYLFYGSYYTSGGSFSVTLNSVPAADQITGQTTMTAQLQKGNLTNPYLTNAATAMGVAVARYIVPKNTMVTMQITISSATSASNPVTIFGVGMPQARSRGIFAPVVYFAGALRQPNDTNATATALLNATNLSIAQTLQGDGLNVNFIDIRRYLNDSVDMANVNEQNCPAVAAGYYGHPNDCGYKHLAQAFHDTIGAVPLVHNAPETFKTGIIASGSPPTLASSCTVGSQVGGNAAGSFVLGSSCSSIVNFTFNMTAPNDWFCAATNAMTGIPLGHSNTGASTTMANIQVNGSNGDLIRFACTPF